MLGLIFGLPALRVKGFYLAISTLAAHYLIWFVLVRYFGGDKGHLVARPNILGLRNLGSEVEIYYIVLVLVLVATFVIKNLVRGKTGRAFVAIKDHDFVATSLGINDYYYKLLAFFICCFYGGVAGFLWAAYAGWATVELFPIWNAIWYLGMLIVGGLGTMTGIFFGTLFVSGLDQISFILGSRAGDFFPGIAETAQSAVPLALFSIVLLLFIIYEPRGLAYRWEILKKLLRVFFLRVRRVE